MILESCQKSLEPTIRSCLLVNCVQSAKKLDTLPNLMDWLHRKVHLRESFSPEYNEGAAVNAIYSILNWRERELPGYYAKANEHTSNPDHINPRTV